MTKKCFKCGRRKEIKQFYAHPQMADGYLGKCKACTKKAVKTRYYSPEGNERVREYERRRFKTPERKAQVLAAAQRRRLKNPGKARARYTVSNAIKGGRLIRKPCERCGDIKAQAHHSDYRKPLQVTWLCRRHHMEAEGKQAWQ